MALQDLTPQLRTRLSRMERAVGWFVLLATLLLLAGFAYYLYATAERKGWFIQKVNYQTSLNNAAGLKVGDPVQLMGFNVGEITRIEANGPYDYYSVTVYFQIKRPYFGYLWSDSAAKVTAADFLGNRVLEVTKGIQGLPTVRENTNKVAVGMLKNDYVAQRQAELQKLGRKPNEVLAILNAEASTNRRAFYARINKNSVYWLQPEESPALTERLEKLVEEVEQALPNYLALTNQIVAVLTNASALTSNLNVIALDAQPAVSNVSAITADLRGRGAMGEWLLPTNLHAQIESALTNASETLAAAHGTLEHADTNLVAVLENLNRSLENLANMTSNLDAQVQANTNILTSISDAIVHTDEFIQGLKRHWLFRSAFKTKPPPRTNAPPVILRSPRDQTR